jgi:hypothetical protein
VKQLYDDELGPHMGGELSSWRSTSSRRGLLVSRCLVLWRLFSEENNKNKKQQVTPELFLSTKSKAKSSAKIETKAMRHESPWKRDSV